MNRICITSENKCLQRYKLHKARKVIATRIWSAIHLNVYKDINVNRGEQSGRKFLGPDGSATKPLPSCPYVDGREGVLGSPRSSSGQCPACSGLGVKETESMLQSFQRVLQTYLHFMLESKRRGPRGQLFPTVNQDQPNTYKGAVTIYHDAHDFANHNKEGICNKQKVHCKYFLVLRYNATSIMTYHHASHVRMWLNVRVPSQTEHSDVTTRVFRPPGGRNTRGLVPVPKQAQASMPAKVFRPGGGRNTFAGILAGILIVRIGRPEEWIE
ncbi:uncharacterized protein G2W53_038560 [Senna tora]|uniref:Uncharacterized protein n=1 Tax=Senna tora TaxID=362788 RepID=A0A834SZK8_9FABA|nr:uncharacterized protein G2W53_038560 [Senna tora]